MITATTATDTTTVKWIGLGVLLTVAWFAAGLAWLRVARKRTDRLRVAEVSKVNIECDEIIRTNDHKLKLLRAIVRSRQALPTADRSDDFRDGRKAA